MRELLVVVFCYVTVVVQTSVCPQLVVAGACLDAFAWVVVFAALFGRGRQLFLVGAGLGLLRDLAGTGSLGPFAMAYCVCAYAMQALRGAVHRQWVVTQMVVVAAVCFLSHLLAGTAAMLVGDADVGLGALLRGAGGGALYTALLTPLVFLVFRQANRLLGNFAPMRQP